MHTITTTAISPLVVAAARRVDAEATVNELPARFCLVRYWWAQIRAVVPQRPDDKPTEALTRFADALASEDVTEAVDCVLDYREFTDRPANGGTLTRMMVETLLDWSKWCGDPRIDDARAQDWLRSLLT